MKMIEYELIAEGSAPALNRSVTRRLEQGWELYGHPSVSTQRYGTCYIQAVVKYEQPSQRG